MGKMKEITPKAVRASRRSPSRISRKLGETREMPDGMTPTRPIQPVDREGSVLKLHDELVSSVMSESGPIAYVKEVFPNGSYELGWIDIAGKHSKKKVGNIISREAQPFMMWVKARA